MYRGSFCDLPTYGTHPGISVCIMLMLCFTVSGGLRGLLIFSFIFMPLFLHGSYYRSVEDPEVKRVFGVRFSGHGSSFTPEFPVCNKTFDAAKEEAIAWELKADTIGGRAEIVEDLGNGTYKEYNNF